MSRIKILSFPTMLVLLLSACAGSGPISSHLPDGLPVPEGPVTIYSVVESYEFLHHPAYEKLDIYRQPRLPGMGDRFFSLGDSILAMGDESRSLIALLNTQISKKNEGALCFEPRHALIYETRYGLATVLICYQCKKVEVNIGNWIGSFPLVEASEALDNIFLAHGVPLADKLMSFEAKAKLKNERQ